MRAKRVDTNHGEIRDALRRCGWKVMDLSRIGNGVPDLLVCRGDVVRLVEVKRPKGTLTSLQVSLQDKGWPIHIVRTVQDAVDLR